MAPRPSPSYAGPLLGRSLGAASLPPPNGSPVCGDGPSANRSLAGIADALGRLHRAYDAEGFRRQEVIGALQALIDCTRLHYAEQKFPQGSRERLLSESEKPDNVLRYMQLLLDYAGQGDQLGPLADLHFLDCWLTSLPDRQAGAPG